ncbi:MAG: hypothetical protein HYV52_02505 [Parcubacteria group bacterium]|nr:hypothetical protein [Parcubacteria group bacterium]
MSKYLKIILILAAITILGGGFWLYKSYNNIKNEAIDDLKEDNEKFIQEQASVLIDQSVWQKTTQEQARVFENFFDKIQSSRLFRIKIYDREPKIIWSNLTEIIGEKAADNDEVKEALDGETAFEFKSLSKAERTSERQYTEFTETYVPILDSQKNVLGVMEIYQTFNQTKKDINNAFIKNGAKIIVELAAGFIVSILVIKMILKKI